MFGTAGNTLSLMTFISVLFGPKDMQIILAESSLLKKKTTTTVIIISFSCTTAVSKPLSLLVEAFQRKQIVIIKCSAFAVLKLLMSNFDRLHNKTVRFSSANNKSFLEVHFTFISDRPGQKVKGMRRNEHTKRTLFKILNITPASPTQSSAVLTTQPKRVLYR